jgi:hypothetical protein
MSFPPWCAQMERRWFCRGAMRLVTNSTPTMVPVTLAFRRSWIRGRSVFKASLGSASLAQVVSLAGSHQ